MLCCVRVNWSWKSPLLVWWMTLVTLISNCYIEIIPVWSSAQEYREFLCNPSSGWCSLGPNTLKSATYSYISHAPLFCPRLPTQDTRVTTLSIPRIGVIQNTCEGMFACLLSGGCNWGQRAVRSPRMLHCISSHLAWVLIPFQYTSRFSWTWTTISWLLRPSHNFFLYFAFVSSGPFIHTLMKC